MQHGTSYLDIFEGEVADLLNAKIIEATNELKSSDMAVQIYDIWVDEKERQL